MPHPERGRASGSVFIVAAPRSLLEEVSRGSDRGESCGVDVHQALVVACPLVGEAGRKPHKEVRTFDEKLSPYREQHSRLMQIPGVDRVGAASIIAEMGESAR